MTNVLPSEAREHMMRIMRARFILTGSLVVAGTACIAILAILPAFLSVYVPDSYVDPASTGAASDSEVQVKLDREAIARTKVLLTELAPLARDTASASAVISAVYNLRPSGITIDRISYRPGAPGTMSITGTTVNRESVSAYREKLARDGRFENVTVPVAALVGTLAGSFTITLSGTF